MTVRTFQVAVCLLFWGASALAQSSLGEVLDKGGKKMMKKDYAAMAPFRHQFEWPVGGGEGDLIYAADGTLSGTEYHWGSRSESPATGTWTVDDNGKWCIKKDLSAWNKKADFCWFAYKLGDEYFAGFSDTDRDARVRKVTSVTKLP